MIADGSVDVGAVISHDFGLEDTEAALTLARTDPHSRKGVVRL